MKTYEVDVHFFKSYSVKAKNAEGASGELQKMIDSDNLLLAQMTLSIICQTKMIRLLVLFVRAME